IQADIRQLKPLITPEPLSKDIAEAEASAGINLLLGKVNLEQVNLSYDNSVSAVNGKINIGNLEVDANHIDLRNSRVYLDDLVLSETTGKLTMGKQETTELIEKEVAQEAVARSRFGWDFRIASLVLDNNHFSFDNEYIKPKSAGI